MSCCESICIIAHLPESHNSRQFVVPNPARSLDGDPVLRKQGGGAMGRALSTASRR